MDLTINTTAAQIKLSGVNSAEQTAKAENAENTEDVQAETPAVQARKFDTVELSTEAEQYLTEDTTNNNAGVNILEEYTSDSTDSTDSTGASDSTDSLDELYTYTDDELADLLRDGEITQTQYNTEMAKRTTSAE